MTLYVVQISSDNLIGDSIKLDSLRKVFEWTKNKILLEEIENDPLCRECGFNTPEKNIYKGIEDPLWHSFKIVTGQVIEIQKIVELSWRFTSDLPRSQKSANEVLTTFLQEERKVFGLELYEI
jgi:hypothetical protein